MKQDTTPGGPARAPRVSFWTLGCRLNQHDTAAMRDALGAAGYREAGDGERPDVVVVNTCTVTTRADQEARQLIRRLAREHPEARLVVTGCYAQRAPREVAALPGVTDVIGTPERDRLAERLRPSIELVAREPSIAVSPARSRRAFAPASPLAFGRTRALLKVQDGCDAFCSYCVVPYVRGRSRSLPLEDAVAQARRLLGAGFHEIVLTGADLGAYGRDLGVRGLLPRLVEAILALGPSHRVRLSSIEPNKVEVALAAMAHAEPRLCRHFHLPLQSGSESVLRAMRRRYAPRDVARLVERLTAGGPTAIGVDLIVGFPDESDADFEETYRFVDRLPVTHLHVFRYAPRPGTRAARERGPAVAGARERSERLRALGAAKQAAFYASLVGSVLPSIPEGTSEVSGSEEGGCLAMTDLYAPVRMAVRPSARGIVPVRVDRFERGVLAGTACG